MMYHSTIFWLQEVVFLRPLVASLATLPPKNEETKFPGHIDIRKYGINDRMNTEEVGEVGWNVSIISILEPHLVFCMKSPTV